MAGREREIVREKESERDSERGRKRETVRRRGGGVVSDCAYLGYQIEWLYM